MDVDELILATCGSMMTIITAVFVWILLVSPSLDAVWIWAVLMFSVSTSATLWFNRDDL